MTMKSRLTTLGKCVWMSISLCVCFAMAVACHAADLATTTPGKPAIPFPEALQDAGIHLSRMAEGQTESLIVGNGDLYGIVLGKEGGIRLRITKNDIWDARVDTSKDGPLPKVNIRTAAVTGSTGAPPSYGNAFPQPLCAAALRIGASSVAQGALDLQRAVATVTSGNGDKTDIRVLADRNVLLITTREAVSIEPGRAGQTGTTDGVEWLHVTLPGDMDYKGMEYSLAVAGTESIKVVALVTSFDITTGDVRGAATVLAKKTLAEVEQSQDQLVAGHEKAWRDFWARSGVELGDRDLQHWWYRMMYFARTVSQPGGRFPVALMPPLATDSTPWHADFHFNYNSWQPFWSVISANHPELADPWISYVHGLLPRAQWQAKEVFDCEGVYYSISQFLHEPDPAACKSVNRRSLVMSPWGMTIGMVGMTAGTGDLVLSGTGQGTVSSHHQGHHTQRQQLPRHVQYRQGPAVDARGGRGHESMVQDPGTAQRPVRLAGACARHVHAGKYWRGGHRHRVPDAERWRYYPGVSLLAEGAGCEIRQPACAGRVPGFSGTERRQSDEVGNHLHRGRNTTAVEPVDG